jgi:hypothetical protein
MDLDYSLDEQYEALVSSLNTGNIEISDASIMGNNGQEIEFSVIGTLFDAVNTADPKKAIAVANKNYGKKDLGLTYHVVVVGRRVYDANENLLLEENYE